MKLCLCLLLTAILSVHCQDKAERPFRGSLQVLLYLVCMPTIFEGQHCLCGAQVGETTTKVYEGTREEIEQQRKADERAEPERKGKEVYN